MPPAPPLAAGLMAVTVILAAISTAEAGQAPEQPCCTTDGGPVPDLLFALHSASLHYEALARRTAALVSQKAAYGAVLHLPLEAYAAVGAALAVATCWASARRARRAATAEAAALRAALSRCTVALQCAQREAADLSARWQAVSQAGDAATAAAHDARSLSAAPSMPAPDLLVAAAAEASPKDATAPDAHADTAPCRSSDKPASRVPPSKPCAPLGRGGGGGPLPGDTEAAGALHGYQTAASTDELLGMLDHHNRSLVEQGLGHQRLCLAPASAPAPPGPGGAATASGAGDEQCAARGAPPPPACRADSPLARAAAGAAVWPCSGAAGDDAPPAARDASQDEGKPVSSAGLAEMAEELRRLRRELWRLQEERSGGGGGSTGGVGAGVTSKQHQQQQQQQQQPALVALQAPPLPGGHYVTHRELELSQENAMLRTMLATGVGAAAPAPQSLAVQAGWVNMTRGSGGVSGGGGGSSALDHSAAGGGGELWLPGAALAGSGSWGSPLLAGSARALGGTPPRHIGSAGGDGGRGGAASEGSVQALARTPPSGGRAPAPLRTPGGPRGGGHCSPGRRGSGASAGAGGGTPREKIAYALALHSACARIESLSAKKSRASAPVAAASGASAAGAAVGAAVGAAAAAADEDWGL